MASSCTDCWWRTATSAHGTVKPGRRPRAQRVYDAYYQSATCSGATGVCLLVAKEAVAEPRVKEH